MNRLEILKNAAQLTGHDRDKTYGPPYTNMSNYAELLHAYLRAKYDLPPSFNISAEDAAHFCVLQKMARTMSGVHHEDNYIDAAAYMSMAGECAEKDDQ